MKFYYTWYLSTKYSGFCILHWPDNNISTLLLLFIIAYWNCKLHFTFMLQWKSTKLHKGWYAIEGNAQYTWIKVNKSKNIDRKAKSSNHCHKAENIQAKIYHFMEQTFIAYTCAANIIYNKAINYHISTYKNIILRPINHQTTSSDLLLLRTKTSMRCMEIKFLVTFLEWNIVLR